MVADRRATEGIAGPETARSNVPGEVRRERDYGPDEQSLHVDERLAGRWLRDNEDGPPMVKKALLHSCKSGQVRVGRGAPSQRVRKGKRQD